ncbi:hypothetical protein GWI33_011592 [Rhynchophorus ferrugineus]|uniref:Uncharacterized protein n=1 Tax=Rhynchophorus ferrugineus TaxID=354439 RepID=A0A834MBG7_RHYFE|nr:hypothetical protein GWI33_011592 [Rhynchophorus ferrugineus]
MDQKQFRVLIFQCLLMKNNVERFLCQPVAGAYRRPASHTDMIRHEDTAEEEEGQALGSIDHHLIVASCDFFA